MAKITMDVWMGVGTVSSNDKKQCMNMVGQETFYSTHPPT